ncbi:neuropeptides capa receptor-like [Physella acuta]|uniref:neuropeptides capa receptor-like n=1 Tax=Physella acuta TaxID=109671 RepID=UPI0027DE887C|nr:neuropeptides capa receptor-like [Physella acuta]
MSDYSTEFTSSIIDSSIPVQTTISTRDINLVVKPIVLDFFLTFNLFVSGIIGILGISGNIINIIVFYKQGYEDSVNITLTALAVSDIGALVTVLMFNVMENPWFLSADLPISQTDVSFILAFYPHNYFIRVCGFITAFASCERCLCVLVPLKVKQIVTKKVSLLVNLFIFIILLLDLFPVYYIVYLDWVFFPQLNRSVIAVNARQNPYNVFGISYFVSDLFVPYFTFFIIIVCNAIIGIKLNTRSKWINSISISHSSEDNTVSNKEKFVSNKEKKVVLMLTVVSVIFIVCLIPQSGILTAVSQVSGLMVGGVYYKISLIIYSISYVTETVSSSVNIVVYYKMSSRYKNTLRSIFF